MANPNPKRVPKHLLFKKGNKANPIGGRAHNPLSKALRNLTVESFREIIEITLKGNLADLEKIIKDPNTSALQVGVATSFYKAMKAGDYATIERIAERIVGKIPEQINLVSQNMNANVTVPTESPLTKEEIDAAYDKFDSEV